jgi:sterol desaturase/sphingolipid hydroxylase (fatty acid hydroxylase superfamily)
VTAGWLLPLIAFASLVVLERVLQPARAESPYARADHLLNFAGLLVQGAAVPVAGYLIATRLLAAHWPGLAGTLHIGWLGAFALNFVAVDFLYYWQHRLFHRVPVLWALHQCHHASPVVSVWATSRNSLAVNFLFVYMLVNPLLGFLCDRPDGFFAAAAVTASLDLWRHSRLPEKFSPVWLGRVLITPSHHHAHHSPDGQAANFGANLILWDRLCGTARESHGYPAAYGTCGVPGSWRQFLFPW